MDPIAVAACGAGAAMLLAGQDAPSTLPMLVVFIAAMVGLHRITRSKQPIFIACIIAASFVVSHTWELAPRVVEHALNGREHRDMQHEIAHVLFTGALAWSVIAFRARSSVVLMIIVLAAFGVHLVTHLLATTTANESVEQMLMQAIDRGWHSMGLRLVGVVWLAVAIAPKVTRLPKRTGAILVVVASAVVAAVFAGVPERTSGAHQESAVWIMFFTLEIAFVLAAIGFGGLARNGAGRSGWVALALSIAQIFATFAGIALVADTRELAVGLAIGLTPFFIAIGVVTAGASSLDLRLLRNITAIFALVSAFGTSVTSIVLLAALRRLGRIEEPYVAFSLIAQSCGLLTLVCWVACLSFWISPPALNENR